MQVDQRRDGDVLTIALNGRLDGQSSAEFEPTLLTTLADGSGRVVIDCGELAYVSSAGLRVLLMAAKQMRQGGGRLALSGLNETVRQVFDVSGFSSLFEIHGSAAEARSAIA